MDPRGQSLCAGTGWDGDRSGLYRAVGGGTGEESATNDTGGWDEGSGGNEPADGCRVSTAPVKWRGAICGER
jgi:hypothetical protein